MTDITLGVVPNPSYPFGTQFNWNFGANASPSTATGAGPHIIQYTTSGVKTVTCTATHNSVESVETTNITVSNCPGNIAGTIKNLAGVGLGSYNMRLFEDFNDDGIPDGPFVRNIFSNSGGGWAMASLYPGNYILEQCNGVVVQTVSITDLGNYDGIVDPMTPVTPPSNPANVAVKIPVRKSQINGTIEIIMNI